jgi:Ala-tRNA(Pro) deacylase
MIFAELTRLGISYQLEEHDPVFTVEECADIHARIPGNHTKNLFLKDHFGQFWLVTLPHHVRADLKGLAVQLEAKKFSFGKAEDLLALLGLLPGSVTPLGAYNDSAGAVRIVLDERLLANGLPVQIHPLRNTATIGLAPHDLVAALTAWNHAPRILRVAERAETA